MALTIRVSEDTKALLNQAKIKILYSDIKKNKVTNDEAIRTAFKKYLEVEQDDRPASSPPSADTTARAATI